MDAGAPAAVVAALRAHPGVAEVAECGYAALRCIAVLPAGRLAIDATGWRFPYY